MYKLLADESGLKDANKEKVCVVAGLVGSEDQWSTFDIGWKRVLDEFEVPFFHGLEFWDWHLEDGRVIRPTPYQDWTDDDDFAFVDALLRVIEDAGLWKVGAGVDIRLFFELTEDERRWLTTSALYDKDWGARGKPNDPWFTAFQQTILDAGKIVPVGEKLLPVFDRRCSDQRKKEPEHDKAIELYTEMLDQMPRLKIRDRLGDSLTFSSRDSVLGLQAADLLANRSRVYVVTGFGDDPLSVRLRDFLERGKGYMRMLGLRGMDIILRGCPFRTTFWETDRFRPAKPDYIENMRKAGVNVVAYKGVNTETYYSHYIKPEKLVRLKRLGVSGDLVYIAGPESEIPQAKDPESDTQT